MPINLESRNVSLVDSIQANNPSTPPAPFSTSHYGNSSQDAWWSSWSSSHAGHHHRSPHQHSSDGNILFFLPTIILALAFALFAFCMGFCINARARRGVPANTATTNVTAKGGLSKDVIESFPTMLYSEVKNFNLREGTLECAVCISGFEDDDTLRLLSGCSHAFHPDCIDTWLDSHTTCPVCRADLTAGRVVAVEMPVQQVGATVEAAQPEAVEEVRVWTAEESERFTLRLPESLRAEMAVKSMERSMSVPGKDWSRGKRRWQSLDLPKLDGRSLPKRMLSLQPSRDVRGGGVDEGESSSAAAASQYRRL